MPFDRSQATHVLNARRAARCGNIDMCNIALYRAAEIHPPDPRDDLVTSRLIYRLRAEAWGRCLQPWLIRLQYDGPGQPPDPDPCQTLPPDHLHRTSNKSRGKSPAR